MKITVSIWVSDGYTTLVTNDVALDLPGKNKAGANLVKEHITGFVQDACDILIPKTIDDLNEHVEKAENEAEKGAENTEDRPTTEDTAV